MVKLADTAFTLDAWVGEPFFASVTASLCNSAAFSSLHRVSRHADSLADWHWVAGDVFAFDFDRSFHRLDVTFVSVLSAAPDGFRNFLAPIPAIALSCSFAVVDTHQPSNIEAKVNHAN